MFTVSIVHVGGMVWLKPVATVLGFEPVLYCDVWYVLCYVWKNHLLKCFCNNR